MTQRNTSLLCPSCHEALGWRRLLGLGRRVRCGHCGQHLHVRLRQRDRLIATAGASAVGSLVVLLLLHGQPLYVLALAFAGLYLVSYLAMAIALVRRAQLVPISPEDKDLIMRERW